MQNLLKKQLKKKLGWLTIPIQGGPLKGMKWSVTSGGNFIRGRYEIYKTQAILNLVKPQDVVYDIGGHVGYYSVLFSKLIGTGGEVFVFEPCPVNLSFLKRHLFMNKIENVTLIEKAVSDESGLTLFNDDTGSGTGHLSKTGSLKVESLILDEFIEKNKYPDPNFIKMDIEGGEIKALKGARQIIERAHPKMILASHGKKEHDFVLGFLKDYKYQHEILNPEAIKGDTEILAY